MFLRHCREHSMLIRLGWQRSVAMGCLFVDREKGDQGKAINKEVMLADLHVVCMPLC